jgi:hypothetical protein
MKNIAFTAAFIEFIVLPNERMQANPDSAGPIKSASFQVFQVINNPSAKKAKWLHLF